MNQPRVTDLIRSKDLTFSFEIIPPTRGQSATSLLKLIESLLQYNPKFIDVTSHSTELNYREALDGTVTRTIRKKRPGTIGICGVIQNRFNIPTVAHLLCRGFTREETEDAIIELSYLGINNVLALQGDEPNYKKRNDPSRSNNRHAIDLVSQLSELKSGSFLEPIKYPEPINMCVGVAGYPEKHFESPNMMSNISRLKDKVTSGADYIVTQMFFDNEKFYQFKKDCRSARIKVPIIPGIKILSTKSQLCSIPRRFSIDIPYQLSVSLSTKDYKGVKESGVTWAIEQCLDLISNGETHLHFYVMNKTKQIDSVMTYLSKAVTSDGVPLPP